MARGGDGGEVARGVEAEEERVRGEARGGEASEGGAWSGRGGGGG